MLTNLDSSFFIPKSHLQMPSVTPLGRGQEGAHLSSFPRNNLDEGNPHLDPQQWGSHSLTVITLLGTGTLDRTGHSGEIPGEPNVPPPHNLSLTRSNLSRIVLHLTG